MFRRDLEISARMRERGIVRRGNNPLKRYPGYLIEGRVFPSRVTLEFLLVPGEAFYFADIFFS